MYCTLQEAYNVPSFDPPSRKKRCSPDAQAQAKASAVPYEPYRRDGGNGEGDFTMYRYGTPKSVQNQEPIQGNKPLQRRIPYQTETFMNRDENRDNAGMRTSYRALKGDRDQYCKDYGVCSADQMERFTNPPSQEDSNGMCPTSPDIYNVPMTEESKRQYDKALETSLNQETASTAPYVPKMRYDDLNQITGYYDEDLEQYLKNSEASNVPKRFPMNPNAKPTDALYSPATSPLQQTLRRFSNESITKPLQTENLTGGDDTDADASSMFGFSSGFSSYGWDLALFILAGVLIIFLIDQLFKMGVMLGMRHTMELMTPLMKEFEAMMKK